MNHLLIQVIAQLLLTGAIGQIVNIRKAEDADCGCMVNAGGVTKKCRVAVILLFRNEGVL